MFALQGGDFDFADKTSLQADAIAPNVDHTYVDDEDHEYGSGIDGPVDSAGTVYEQRFQKWDVSRHCPRDCGSPVEKLWLPKRINPYCIFWEIKCVRIQQNVQF